MDIKSYKNKKGETKYKFQKYIGRNSETGKSIKTTRSGFNTYKEAKIAYKELEKLTIEDIETTQSKFTYEEVYNKWIVKYKVTVEKSTYLKTSRIFKNHIIPKFGNLKIANITEYTCDKAIDDWSNKFVKVKIYKSYASLVFKHAIKLGIIRHNPMDNIEIIKKKITLEDFLKEKEKASSSFLTKEELNTFLNCLSLEDDYMIETFFNLLALTGMRKGEALALTWGDINFTEQSINISKAIGRGEEGLYLKLPKTGKERKIFIDKSLTQLLTNWKNSQKDYFKNLKPNSNPNKQLVFSTLSNQLITPEKTNAWIKKIQMKYNLKNFTTHALRHTHCSLLFEAGVSNKLVQERLGHNDIKTTLNIYTHVTESANQEVATTLEKFLSE